MSNTAEISQTGVLIMGIWCFYCIPVNLNWMTVCLHSIFLHCSSGWCITLNSWFTTCWHTCECWPAGVTRGLAEHVYGPHVFPHTHSFYFLIYWLHLLPTRKWIPFSVPACSNKSNKPICCLNPNTVSKMLVLSTKRSTSSNFTSIIVTCIFTAS